MTLTELKRELSQLSGEDMFKPKYRDVFKRFAGDDLTDAEVEKMEEMGIPEDEQPAEVVEAKDEAMEAKEEAADEKADEMVAEDKAPEAEQITDKEEDINKAEDEREIDKIEETKAEQDDETEKADEKAEEVKEESEEIGKSVDEFKDDKMADELLDTKIELALVRGGVRDDKLEAAKRMAKYEIKDLDELDKVKELLDMYPEWLKTYNTQKFGMPVDEGGYGLTAEEKRLKELGY